MTRTRWERFFSGCPGAWFGCEPTSAYAGHVTVDVAQLVGALAFIRRRPTYRIVGTRLPAAACAAGGVTIDVDKVRS